MHLFRIRSKSQKPFDRSQDSIQASTSASRPPLLTQTNLALSTSEDARPSSSSSSFSNNLDVSKPQIGRKFPLCEPDELGSEVQFTRNSAAQEMSYGKYYTQNDLNTFSFGAAPSSEASSLHPSLSPRRDSDADDLVPFPDTTPRPSVASTHPRSHQSQSFRAVELNQASYHLSKIKSSEGASQKRRERGSDTASTRTFGTSPSSRPSGLIPRASRTNSSRSNTTTDSDLSSDGELDGCHPLPAQFLNEADQDVSYPSEEEYDVYKDEYDRDPEFEIEIDSVAHPGSDRCTIDYRNASRESVPFSYAERRGSQALPIPISSDKSPLDNQVKENSLPTLRRPSRSLDQLHSFNFAQEAASSSFAPHAEHPLPPSPTSVPESEGDWRDLRKKSIQRDKDLPSISPRMISSSSSGLEGFDTSWMHQHANGFIGFDMSEMQDIVVADMIERRSSNHPLRRESAISASRRQSNASSGNVDIWYRQATGWASQKDRDQRQMWTFVKENDRLAHEDHSRQNNHVERERPSISSFFGSRPSSSAASEPGGISFFDGRDKGKAAGKEKAPKEIWRGMPPESEEFWNNQATGRFRVHRRNTPCPEPGKPPQHRLNITFIRTPSIVNPVTRDVLDGPSVSIHRHSKADAFSISRHFRAKSSPSDARRQSSFKDPSDGTRKKSNMILLATRKVQKAYTSTTTTRMLQSHGLLDNRTSAEGMQQVHEHEKRARAKDQGKEKDKKEREALKEKKKGVSTTKKITNKTETKSKDSKWLPDSSGGSAGSVSIALSSDSGTFANSSTSETTPDLSEGSSSFGSIKQSVISYETTSSDRTVLRAIPFQRHHPNDGGDSSDEGPRYPTRTPHRETYAVLPPEVFEIAHHQEHPTHGLFGWGKSRGGGNQIAHRPNPYEASYNPPWPVTTPRINSETRKGIVDDLNTSFQDVGLLPVIGEIRSSQREQQIRRKREREQQAHANRRPDQPQPEIFEDIPSNALCMLLPLWPGETDPASARKYQSAPPPLSPNSRQYILIYYKVQPGLIPPHEEAKAKLDKKRSRISPTSSHESTNKREERGILLNNFYIGARIVSHRDLQGSGIRIPDVGLAVSGPLDEAYRNMPTNMPSGEYILGVCNSRKAGIDFLPEFFEKMGLSRNMPNPNPGGAADDDDSQAPDLVAVLTPLGRAVMEMAWLGGLALTSFNPGG